MEKQTENIQLRWWGCGHFDILMGDVNVAIDPYLFGENLENAEAIYDYIFISHEHFDHLHPKTLRKLCRGERFKKLFVCVGGMSPAEPIDKNYGDAAFARDLPIDKHIPPEMIQVVYPKYRKDQNRQVPGPTELDLGPLRIEVVESDEAAREDLPTCGYLITHTEKNVSFYHTGDLHNVFPTLEQLKGRVDFLIHMKTGLGEWEIFNRLLDYVEPSFLIPIHYRTDRLSDPVPTGHWPPNVTDANAFIESVREHAGGKTKILPFTAGILYEVELPSKKVAWQWEWQNSWTVPTWGGE